jgi:hypothetical protein
MTDRYLLYIDVLGFSALIEEGFARIDDLYEVIASLNVHDHPTFRVIVFSDTILVYNVEGRDVREDRSYLVMFLCEFAQDLQRRLTGRGIFFRAILVRGQFTHYELNAIPCFFGTALVRAYRAEKTIRAIGLFMERSLVPDSAIFRSVAFDDVHNFVFITQGLNTVEDLWGGVIDRFELEDTDLIHVVVPELLFLREVRRLAAFHQDEGVRQKHANTLNVFRARYPRTLGLLEANDFEFQTLCPDAKWSEAVARYPESYSWAVKNRVIY